MSVFAFISDKGRVDPMLARQITRHRSEKSFGRYSNRALEVEAEKQFYQVFGES